MTLAACASLTQRADPDRFRVAMSVPMPARRVLFALYAFNAEVARAPWVTQEPMIAEMRLQWWRDALEGIAAGTPRRHEVVDELVEVLDPAVIPDLDALIAARRWDIYTDPFEDADHLRGYLRKTGGGLMWAACACLGQGSRDTAMSVGFGAAVARFLQAVPVLQDKGRRPLMDPSDEGVIALATEALEALNQPTQGPAMRDAYLAKPILRQAIKRPNAVFEGALHVPHWQRPLRLLNWR